METPLTLCGHLSLCSRCRTFYPSALCPIPIFRQLAFNLRRHPKIIMKTLFHVVREQEHHHWEIFSLMSPGRETIGTFACSLINNLKGCPQILTSSVCRVSLHRKGNHSYMWGTNGVFRFSSKITIFRGKN